MKTNSEIYLSAVRKKLAVSGKQKKLLLRQLSQSLQDFEEDQGKEIGLNEIEARFGSSAELAEVLLHQSGAAELTRSINKKRTVIWVIIVACIVALLAVLFYIAHDHKQKEAFDNGRYVEVIYEYNVEGTPPPKPEDARIYGD